MRIRAPLVLSEIRGAALGRRLTKLPRIDFAIAGFPKCATTSVHKTLSASDAVYMPDHEVQLASILGGVTRYDQAGTRLTGVKNPNLLYEQHNLCALCRANPLMRLLIGVRDPVDFLFSFYQYRKLEIARGEPWLRGRLARDPGVAAVTFGDIVFRGRAMLGVRLGAGLYAKYLKALLRWVPPEQILVYSLEEMKHSEDEVYGRILDFLGLEASCIAVPKRENVSADRHEDRSLFEPEFDALREYYEKPNERLRSLLAEAWDRPQRLW